MVLRLADLVSDFANGISCADERRPQALSMRSKKPYRPGIGPHTELQTVDLVMNELARIKKPYRQFELNVPYPEDPKNKCDLALRHPTFGNWFIELKLLRLLGDNGKLNDNMVMHILSPYPQHRSALTDCMKLSDAQFDGRKAILILAYEAPEWPFEPVISAFETLAREKRPMSERVSAGFSGLIHPVHRAGVVFGWDLG